MAALEILLPEVVGALAAEEGYVMPDVQVDVSLN